MQTYYLIDDPFLLGWYFIFIIFIMYCIMPVSLHWCIAMCLASSLSHIITTLIKQPHGEPILKRTQNPMYQCAVQNTEKMSLILPQLSLGEELEVGLDKYLLLNSVKFHDPNCLASVIS